MLKWTFQTTTTSSSNSNCHSNHHSETDIIPKRRHSTILLNMPSSRESVGTAIETIFRRKSLSNTARRKSRHEELNKENLNNRFSSSPFGNNIIPLQDLSNSQSPNRTPIRTPQQQQQQRYQFNTPLSIAPGFKQYSCTLPTYSPCQIDLNSPETSSLIVDKFIDKPINSRLYELRKNPTNESLSSSKIGDTTLDQMLDAIIESAKKDTVSSQYECPSDTVYEDISIHEMEVKTPPHLKRQKGVRRKHKIEPSLAKEQRPQKMIGLTLPNGIPSPETPNESFFDGNNSDELANMETPQDMIFIIDTNVLSDYKKPQGCSTPTQTDSVKRCLSYSPDSDEEFIGCKRGSVASSTTSSGRYILIKGSIDLAIFIEDGKLNVHVIRCRELQRPNGSTSINAYVKVALLPADNDIENGFQRTAVHRNSSRPYFDHRFKFDFKDDQHFKTKRIQLAVWHRDREMKRSEFLGCMSFGIINILKSNINGSYKLQSQSCLTNPIPAVQLTTIIPTKIPITNQSLPKIQPKNIQTFINEQEMAGTTTTGCGSGGGGGGVGRQSSIDEDESSMSIDSASAGNLIDTNTGQPIAFSKKAIHQRDADENLFLRFLELDPPNEPTPPPSTTGSITTDSGKNSVSRRMSTFAKPAAAAAAAAITSTVTTTTPSLGRTPFTVTKRLTRTAEKGFGFSIVWTHPPRIEKIEPGLSASQNNIQPGDYVIFVDKHNVVTMPEADVLNLIRSQGNTLTLEIFRRSPSTTGGVGTAPFTSCPRRSSGLGITGSNIGIGSTTTAPLLVNGVSKSSRVASAASNYTNDDRSISSPALKHPVTLNLSGMGVGGLSSIACSNTSIETTKRKMQLPQVTFSKEIERRRLLLLNEQRPNGINSYQSIGPITDHRRRFLLQLISREQNFVAALQFGIQRFVTPLLERKDLVSPNDHRTLFQNIDELMRISEDILEQLVNPEQEQEPQMNFVSRVYLSKTTAICAAYKKYCNGIKRADCVLVNKSRQPGSEFILFITEPQVPRRRPDLTMLIHRPLQHFREILKLMQLLSSHCHIDTEEHKNFTNVINELQSAYREITVGGGLMEPLGEGRPLLTLQDLEARMVFTRCKPFTLAVQGRQWIFGGDLSRVEGRSIKPYWTLLFSDIIVFAKVSRDRVLFITEEPLPIVNIVDSCFNIRKKNTEFRITVDPNGRTAESPTAYCAPDLTRTPKKNTRRKSLILRAPSLELKAVWQNLLQRQIFLVNAALGSTPLSSPLDSPDVLNTLVPLSDIGATTTSMASIKLASMDSLNIKNQQQQQHRNINPVHHMENLIDEKCRILNKTGTPKGSALHLANWMKGQLDKQQEEARLAAFNHEASNNNLDTDEIYLTTEEDEEERITFWTREQLEKRTKELNLAKENSGIRPLHPGFGGKRLSGCEEVAIISDVESEIKSVSHSTTSDSQITVRSSPNANLVDKLSVCRNCHKNCKQPKSRTNSTSPSPPLLSNSLKVQHSQSSPNRCCQINGMLTAKISDSKTRDSSLSSASSTITGSHSDEIHLTKKEPPIKPLRSPRPTSVCSVPITTTASLLNGNLSDSSQQTIHDHVNEKFEKTTNSTELKTSTIHTNITTPKSIPSMGISALTKTSPTITKTSCQKFIKTANKNYIPCNCKCTPEDFSNTTLSPDEMTQETCKLIEDVTKIPKTSNQSSPTNMSLTNQFNDDYQNTLNQRNLHKNCKCICKKNNNEPTEIDDDDLSLVLIGLAQLNPAVKLVNSDAFVPTISIVPPTPDAILSKTSINIWDNQNAITTTTAKQLTINNTPGHAIIENINDTPDDSPQDEEPPYRSMNTTLKRYGTLSDLEKLPNDNENGDQLGSSEEHDDEDEMDIDDGEIIGDDDDDDDIEVITREIFDENQQTSLRNWTARAGSYVAGKISFFEESRAFIDKYLGRWNQEQENDDDQMEECTSGATSGEEVWGTPTSGGDNDDMQMLNSDLTHSSPTRSSGSLNDDDDDTELMMDELLMAPPMTASTIRGLLPRRRLEPLFEEETESDEEKTQQESEDIKKGETAANGHDLEDSTGSSSDEESEYVLQQHRQYHHHQRHQQHQQQKHAPLALQLQIKRMQMQKRNLLMMRNAGLIQTKSIPIRETAITTIRDSPQTINPSLTTTAAEIQRTTIGNTGQTLTTVLKTSAITTITNSENSIISIEEEITISPNKQPIQVRKAKFSPPPPPPRRLLLTPQTNLINQQKSIAGDHQNKFQSDPIQKSGSTADIGSSVDAPTIIINSNQNNQTPDVSSTKDYVVNIDHVENRQSTNKQNENQSKSPILKIHSTTNQDAVLTKEDITVMKETENPPVSGRESPSVLGLGLSPRLEMRLALNHDILGDEDLICYDPGPDLTTILGHDLSTFHRLTGRDLLNRSATNRIQPKEAVISFCQQRNSKMDTPTVNRKRQQQQQNQQNRSTWNNSVYAERIGRNDINAVKHRKNSNSSDGSKLSDLELLAKREKTYCMSQLKSGSPAMTKPGKKLKSSMTKTTTTTMMTTVMSSQTTTMTTSVTRQSNSSIAGINDEENNYHTRKIIQDENASLTSADGGKRNRLYNFLLRRNSENQLNKIFSQNSLNESNGSSTPDRRRLSPSSRKDNDKPSLNRRFWKQLTKRRRANSVTEITEITAS